MFIRTLVHLVQRCRRCIVPALIAAAFLGAAAPRIASAGMPRHESRAPSLALRGKTAGFHPVDSAMSLPDEFTPKQFHGGSAVAYDSIAIVNPKGNETVFDNSGNVQVRVMLSPALKSAAGDRIVILADGVVAVEGREPILQVSGLVRGAHTVEAQVINRDGATVMSSAPVTFYVWQASRLFRNRR